MKLEFGVFPYGKKKVLTMSYDDGPIYDRRLVEIFNKNGIKGTFHLNSGRNSADGWSLSAEECVELFSGHEISCHGKSHPNMTELSDEENVNEILADRLMYENRCGYVIRGKYT